MAEGNPLISVIIPVYNGSNYLARCLRALNASSHLHYEIIVIDDASTDDSAEISRRHGARVFKLPRRCGPAAARNYGAQHAHGEILFFVDSDVLVRPDTISRVVSDFRSGADIAAVFGSYDDDPYEKNFISQYKNLYHHFIHQRSNEDAVSFWAGCGAIRREIFDASGRFDQNRYLEPSIEDIDLGCRVRALGHRLRLDKQLQVKHLKRWSLGSLICCDIFSRAVPWSKLILERRQKMNDLNLRASDRASAGLVGMLVITLSLLFIEPRLLYLALLILVMILFLNWKLYAFFLDKRGLKFCAKAFPLHLAYYVYSSISFALCWCAYYLTRVRQGLTKWLKPRDSRL